MGVDHLSRTAVADGLQRRKKRNWTAGQPMFRGPKPWPCSRPGFTEPAPLDAAGALLPHLCTLACAPWGHRRCVSVALSSRFPALGVTQQAWPLGSPDFPQPDLSQRRELPGRSWSRSPHLLSEAKSTDRRFGGTRPRGQAGRPPVLRARGSTPALCAWFPSTTQEPLLSVMCLK
jgi:hypothetical protein